MAVVPDDGVYEAYYNAKRAYGNDTNELMETLGCKIAADLQKVDAQKLMEASAALTLRKNACQTVG